MITVKRKASQLRRPAPTKDDRETVTPPLVWVTPKRTPDAGASAPRPSAKATERAEAVAAYEAMRAARPLKPPPPSERDDTRGAGACELAREIRRGSYEP